MPAPDLIRLRCPSCNALMSCPASKAGHKAPCPQCGQRLEVPRPAPPPTVLAALVPAPPPVQVPALPPVTFCPHCNCRFRWDAGDVGSRMECPDCQGHFVTPARPGPGELPPAEIVRQVRREEPEERRERSGYRCPFCSTSRRPEVRQKISTAGWVLFVVLLLACFPLCVLALFMREDYRVCSACGIKIG